jgi:hypothetical protein
VTTLDADHDIVFRQPAALLGATLKAARALDEMSLR